MGDKEEKRGGFINLVFIFKPGGWGAGGTG